MNGFERKLRRAPALVEARRAAGHGFILTADPVSCCLCSATATYRVANTGYCSKHKADAAAAMKAMTITGIVRREQAIDNQRRISKWQEAKSKNCLG